MVAVCSGCISGLVAATPSSGMIPLWASVILGIVSGIVCNFSTKIKYLCRVDDSLDVLAEHGIAGIVGLIFNALFGSSTVIGYDGVTVHAGGWIDHNYKQLYIQIVYILATAAYAGGVTAVLCFVINKIPGLHLRIDYNAEEIGMDEDQIGEFAYDYVEVRRDFLDWGNPNVNPNAQMSRPSQEVMEGIPPNPQVFQAVGSSSVSTAHQDDSSIQEKLDSQNHDSQVPESQNYNTASDTKEDVIEE